MADILTLIRIFCGLLILIIPVFSKWYYVFYLLGGFTDAIDGTLARKRGQATDNGAKFDTAADMVFTLAVVIKIAFNVFVPVWLIIWIAVIIFFKVLTIIIGFRKSHRFITVHSIMNKICGVIVFIPPLFIGGNFVWQAKFTGIVIACIIASIAAVQELLFVSSDMNHIKQDESY